MPLYVREYEHIARDRDGARIAAPMEPAIQDQTLTVSATPASVTLDGRTQFVELHATEAVHYRFNATAGTSSMVLPAGGTVFKGVKHNTGSITISARTTV